MTGKIQQNQNNNNWKENQIIVFSSYLASLHCGLKSSQMVWFDMFGMKKLVSIFKNQGENITGSICRLAQQSFNIKY